MTLADTLIPTMPPLHEDEYGVVRVGGSRVTLDTVVAAYWNGMTAEEIVLSYPTLSIADMHATLSYYLRNREKVDAYLAEREQAAEETRRLIDSRSSWRDLRERLLARQAARQGEHP